MKSDVPSINYTVKELVKEIREEQKKQNEKLDSIESHVKRTNGRVTALEAHTKFLQSKSVGVWIADHPKQFVLYLLIIFVLLISDTRQPLMEWVAKFI